VEQEVVQAAIQLQAVAIILLAVELVVVVGQEVPVEDDK
jgi:hypothetical protein